MLFLTPNLGLGGAEMSLFTLLKHLDRERVRPRVVTFFGADVSSSVHRSDYFRPLIDAMGIPITSLEATRVRDIPQAIVRLCRSVRRNRPHVIQTQLFAANIVGRATGRLVGLPVVSTIHSVDYEPVRLATYSNPGNVLRDVIMRRADGYTARHWCTVLLPVSRGVADSTRRWLGIDPHRMTVMYNPIDVDSFRPVDAPARDEIRRRLGIPPEAPLILNVGRIMWAKGQIDLVTALPDVLRRLPDAHLVFLGDTADELTKAQLVAAIDRLGLAGRCHFPGISDRVRDWLYACDVFAFPSLYEGMGIAMAEAMLCRRPIVASSIRTLAEQVQHEVNGLLVPPRNPGALADAIVRLLRDRDLARRLVDAAEQFARQAYDPIQYAARMAEIYERIRRR